MGNKQPKEQFIEFKSVNNNIKNTVITYLKKLNKLEIILIVEELNKIKSDKSKEILIYISHYKY